MSSGRAASQHRMHVEVKIAIQRGVLITRGDDPYVSLDKEPVTAAALRRVGMARVEMDEDGVMELLASRVTGPTGGAVADYGPALEECFAWALVRHSLLRSTRMVGAPLLLSDLLAGYFARAASTIDSRGGVHSLLLPPMCYDLTVTLDGGHRCDGAEWQAHCLLSLLVDNPRTLLHHTTDSMGGADIIFLATHRTTGKTQLVLLQLKNRATSSLPDALRSVDLGTWYTDRGDKEVPAHAELRAILAAHPHWALPVRGVVGSRPVEAAVLHSTAWLNGHELAQSPVLLMQVTPANLGVDIAALGAAERAYGKPLNWPMCLWPTAVRHWDAAAEVLPSVAPPPVAITHASLRVKLTSKAKLADVERVIEALAHEMGGGVSLQRHRSVFTSGCVVTAAFTHAAAAIAAVKRTRARTGRVLMTAGGCEIVAAFEQK